MGQLERYGLYVLCLVIFLILGVTIWGGGELPQTTTRTPQAPIKAPGGAASGSHAGGANATVGSELLGGAKNLDALFAPGPVAPGPGANEPKRSEVKPVDGAANKVDPATADPSKKPPKAGETPRPPAAAVAATYTVKSGDTLEAIAREKLGNPALHLAIAKLNPDVQPTRLRVGTELRLPTLAEFEPAADRPDAARSDGGVAGKAKAAGATYRVKKGDTFEGIAIAQLGSRSRVNELRELNPTVEPTNLRIGMTIRLPK